MPNPFSMTAANLVARDAARHLPVGLDRAEQIRRIGHRLRKAGVPDDSDLLRHAVAVFDRLRPAVLQARADAARARKVRQIAGDVRTQRLRQTALDSL